jgi:hypothetical protein
VEYIITTAPRKRRMAPEGDGNAVPTSASDPWGMDAQASELRLPWRLNSRRA